MTTTMMTAMMTMKMMTMTMIMMTRYSQAHYKCNGEAGLVDCGFWGSAEAKKKTLEFTTDDEVVTMMQITMRLYGDDNDDVDDKNNDGDDDVDDCALWGSAEAKKKTLEFTVDDEVNNNIDYKTNFLLNVFCFA